MKLFYSPTSPFARKTRVVAHESGLSDRIEFIKMDPLTSVDDLIIANPLSQIPTLVANNGISLFDSRVIAEYFDELSTNDEKQCLCRPQGADYYKVQKLHALANGIMENGVALTMEGRRPEEQQSPTWQQRWAESILRSVDFVATSDEQFEYLHIGNLSFVIALEYIDFRQPHVNWREGNDKLVNAIVAIQQRASLMETRFV